MSRLSRDGTAEPVSRDQILRYERGQGNVNFPYSADHEQDWQLYQVDPYYSCYTCDHAVITVCHEKGINTINSINSIDSINSINGIIGRRKRATAQSVRPSNIIQINYLYRTRVVVLFVDHLLLRRPMGLNACLVFTNPTYCNVTILHVVVTTDLSISPWPSPTIFYRDASSALLLYTLSTNSG